MKLQLKIEREYDTFYAKEYTYKNFTVMVFIEDGNVGISAKDDLKQIRITAHNLKDPYINLSNNYFYSDAIEYLVENLKTAKELIDVLYEEKEEVFRKGKSNETTRA